MKRFTLKAIVYVVLCFAGVRTQAQDVLTQHNDLNRTGWNPNETILTQSNVTPTSFGLLYKKMVDDQIYAQPLYVGGVLIGGVAHNIVYVATVNNSVYAFDTDDGTLDPYWQRNLTIAGKTVPIATDVHSHFCNGGYGDFTAVGSLGQTSGYGIVGTPVIDKGRNVIYLVSRSRDLTVDNGSHANDQDWSSAGFYQQFHALSLSTGKDTLGSPVNLDNSITVNGTGDGADASNKIHFDPRRENQRAGLVLYNDVVYVTYAAHCDMDYYHGWVLGFNAGNLSLVTKYITTPNDGRGGIWMSGAAPPVDASGVFYFAVGNALVNDGTSPGNMGLRVVRATPAGGTFTNLSWFKPTSYTTWNNGDLDFGTGIVLIPSANLLVTAHKSGNIVMLRETPTVTGEFNESDATNFRGYIGIGSGNESHSALSYYGGTAKQFVYQFSEKTNVRAYPVNAALPGLGTPVTNSTVPTNTGFEGGFLSVSSNGNSDPSSILWVEHNTTSGGALVALKANDITQQLWSSDNLTVDNLGRYAKMNNPTIANGKVFAPTFSNNLNVYGLLASNDRCVTNVALNKPATGSSNTDAANPASNATDGMAGTRWGITGPTPTYIYVDLQSRFDICKIDLHWDRSNDYPINYNIDISDDGLTWTNIESVVNSTYPASSISSFNENSTARYVRMFVQPGSTFFTSMSEFQVYGSPANSCIAPTGLTANPTQNTAVLSWAPVAGATQYIVRYKSAPVYSYINRIVPNTGNPVTLNISALSCGFDYTYEVQTDCGGGSLSNPVSFAFGADDCTAPCGANFQHFGNADLGDIQVAGLTCYDAPTGTFTVKGSGTGLGGNGDQFQYNFKSVSIDGDPVVHIATQDQIAPLNNNLAGLMLRDSLTDISRFMFIGKTGDNSKIYMIYRTSPGGTAQSMSIARPANANYFRILKSGNSFSAYYATAISGNWVQVGGNQTIPFVGSNWYEGMAVSSQNAPFSSTATFDEFSDASTPLPITLLSFNANNVNDAYVSLNWQTSMELNNDHFDIERSTDGVHFSKILTIKSQGNSDTLQKYNAVDNAPDRGLNFYRLKQVDTDGRFGYSVVQQVKFGVGTGPVVYPNPVSSLFTAVPGSEPIQEIVIYNVQGRAVQYAKNNSPADEMTVNISPLSSGIYILKIKTDSKIYQVKIVKE